MNTFLTIIIVIVALLLFVFLIYEIVSFTKDIKKHIEKKKQANKETHSDDNKNAEK